MMRASQIDRHIPTYVGYVLKDAVNKLVLPPLSTIHSAYTDEDITITIDYVKYNLAPGLNTINKHINLGFVEVEKPPKKYVQLFVLQ
jgi:hypothetical protein